MRSTIEREPPARLRVSDTLPPFAAATARRVRREARRTRDRVVEQVEARAHAARRAARRAAYAADDKLTIAAHRATQRPVRALSIAFAAGAAAALLATLSARMACRRG